MQETINAAFATCIMIVEEECGLDKKPAQGRDNYVHGKYDVGLAIVDRIMCAQLNPDETKMRVPTQGTPGAVWRESGLPDPHGTYYDCERAKLALGHLSDDQIANNVFLDPNIVTLTAAKERIRWLSRALSALTSTFLKRYYALAPAERGDT